MLGLVNILALLLFAQNLALAVQSYSKYGLEIGRIFSYYFSPDFLLKIENHYTTFSFAGIPVFVFNSYLLELLGARLSFNRVVVSNALT